jgi:nitroreductase
MNPRWDMFLQLLQDRRSIRRFKPDPVDPQFIENCLRAAVLAPNSSNTQTWDFYWVQSPEKKQKVVAACLSQSAARTAQELIVVVADPKHWRRSQSSLIAWVEKSKAPKQVLLYYQKLVPFVYRWGFLNLMAPLKWIAATTAGIFRPVPRGPYSRRDAQEIAVKSAALACENLVLAATAQGLSTCMMEGFDERRLGRILKLGGSAKIVMVIGIGYEGEGGTWATERSRLPIEYVVHRI